MSDLKDQMSSSEVANYFGDHLDHSIYKSKRAFSCSNSMTEHMETFFRYQKVKLSERDCREWVNDSDLACWLTSQYGGFEIHPVSNNKGIFISVQKDRLTGDLWLCEKIYYPHHCPNYEEIACIIPMGMEHLIGKEIQETENGYNLSVKGYNQHGLSVDNFYVLGNMAKDNTYKFRNSVKVYRWSESFYEKEGEVSPVGTGLFGDSIKGANQEINTFKKLILSESPTDFLKCMDYTNGSFRLRNMINSIEISCHDNYRSLLGIAMTMNLEVQQNVREWIDINEQNPKSRVFERTIYRYPGANNHYALVLNMFNPKFVMREEMLKGNLMGGIVISTFKEMLNKTIYWL